MSISQSDIEDQSQTPKSVRTDEGQVTERSVKEMIDADRYGQQTQATAVPFGMHVAKTKPPGAVT